MNPVQRGLVTLPFAALLLLASPSLASAHASYLRSDPPDLCGPLAVPRLQASDQRCQTGLVLPSAPDSISITFSEAVSLLGPGIRVFSPSGKRTDQAPAVVIGDVARVGVDAAEPGTYVVVWQVQSTDTHPARGQFAFSVGQPSKPAISGEGLDLGAVTPAGLGLQSLARWLHFAGYAMAFGTLALAVLFGPLTPAISRLTNTGIVLLLLAEPLALLGQSASLGLDQMLDADVLGDALASSFGRLMGFRVAAALMLWVVTGSLRSTAPSRAAAGAKEVFADRFAVARSAETSFDDREGRVRAPAGGAKQPALAVGAVFALAIILAVVDAFGQHAASFQPEWLGLLVHALHLMGLGLWLGALLAVLLGGFQFPKSRLLLMTSIPLAISFGSGLAMAAVHVRTPGALLASTYGQVLGIKQLFVLIAIAAGWMAWHDNSKFKTQNSMPGRKPVWLLAETGALICLMGLAGLLVSLPPPN